MYIKCRYKYSRTKIVHHKSMYKTCIQNLCKLYKEQTAIVCAPCRKDLKKILGALLSRILNITTGHPVFCTLLSVKKLEQL